MTPIGNKYKLFLNFEQPPFPYIRNLLRVIICKITKRSKFVFRSWGRNCGNFFGFCFEKMKEDFDQKLKEDFDQKLKEDDS